MIVGRRLTREEIRAMATRTRCVDETLKAKIRVLLDFDESDDFYAGLLAGMAQCRVFHDTGEGKLVDALVCLVADICDRKELSQ